MNSYHINETFILANDAYSAYITAKNIFGDSYDYPKLLDKEVNVTDFLNESNPVIISNIKTSEEIVKEVKHIIRKYNFYEVTEMRNVIEVHNFIEKETQNIYTISDNFEGFFMKCFNLTVKPREIDSTTKDKLFDLMQEINTFLSFLNAVLKEDKVRT